MTMTNEQNSTEVNNSDQSINTSSCINTNSNIDDATKNQSLSSTSSSPSDKKKFLFQKNTVTISFEGEELIIDSPTNDKIPGSEVSAPDTTVITSTTNHDHDQTNSNQNSEKTAELA
jgi:hypothetical protein